MGVPQQWMVYYFMENPNVKWMITRGTPTYGDVHVEMVGRSSQNLIVIFEW